MKSSNPKVSVGDLRSVAIGLAVDRRYISLLHFLDEIVRNAELSASRGNFMKIIEVATCLYEVSGEVALRDNPDVLHYFVEADAKLIRILIKDTSVPTLAGTDSLMTMIVSDSTRHMSSGDTFLQRRAANCLRLYPTFAAAAITQPNRFEQLLDNIPEMMLLMLRQNLFDDYQQLGGNIIDMLDRLIAFRGHVEGYPPLETSLGLFFLRCASTHEEVALDHDDRWKTRLDNDLAVQRVLARQAYQLDMKEAGLDFLKAEFVAFQKNSNLITELVHGLMAHTEMLIDDNPEFVKARIFPYWRAAFETSSIDFHLLLQFVSLLARHGIQQGYREFLIAGIDSLLTMIAFLVRDPWQDYHRKYYGLFFAFFIFIRAAETALSERMIQRLTDLRSKVPDGEWPAVEHQTRVFAQSFHGFTPSEAQFQQAWRFVRGTESGNL